MDYVVSLAPQTSNSFALRDFSKFDIYKEIWMRLKSPDIKT